MKKTLSQLEKHLGGDRIITLCRELTKKHEEYIYTTIEKAVKKYENEEPRGEYVVVVGAVSCSQRADDGESGETDAGAFTARVDELTSGGMKRNDAIKTAANEFGLKRSEAYDLYEESHRAYKDRTDED